MSLKNIILKSLAVTVAISIVFGNISVCGIGISRAIAENTDAPKINLEIQNEKYVQYNEEENAGVAIQSKLSINSNQTSENYLPTTKVGLEVKLPRLNGCLPERAIVAEARTKATTGEEMNTTINQNYDSNSGLLKVSYENTANDEGKIYTEFNKDAKDEFEIIYIYPEKAYTGNEKEIKLEYTINAKMTFKTENSSITSQNSKNIELTEKENKEDIEEFNITKLEKNIYKGFLYSNVENKTNYDTEYKTVSTLSVLNSQISKDITMELKESEFILNDEEETKVSSNGKIEYKATGISKYEFDRMLGQDGVLEIYNENTLLATVKYVEVNENKKTVKKLAVVYSEEDIRILEDNSENLVIEYPENITSLNVKISKPTTEGFIHFENQNVIKASEDYGSKVEEIKYLSTESTINNNSNIVKIRLSEPETKISVTSSNTSLSTLQTSKTTLTVKLDDTNASTKLFNNPIITVKLPEGLTGGHLSSPEILNGNGLSIKTAKAEKNVITIELEGKQTAYDLNNVSGGVNIVMDIEDIDFSDTTPTHADKIEVTCVQGTNKATTSCNVNIVSKAGLLMLSELRNFDDKDTVLTTIDSKVKTVEIASEAEERTAIQTLTLVNNYDEEITNVEIIGRIGYTNVDIASTFDTNLIKPIEVNKEGTKIYYSENKDASYTDNSWSEKFTQNAKLYKIEIDNNKINGKDSLQLKLNLNIPANVSYNQASYIKTEINYMHDKMNLNDGVTIGLLTESNKLLKSRNITNFDILNQEGKNIPISLAITPNVTQNYVHSGQIVTYTIQVRNNGTEDLTDLILEDIIPNNALYTYIKEVEGAIANYTEVVTDAEIKSKEWKIESLEAGTTEKIEVMLKMTEVSQEQEILNKANLKYNEQIATIENKLIVKPALLTASLTTNSESMLNVKYDVGEILDYYITVKNITNKKLNNANVQFELPSTLKYFAGGPAKYDEIEGYIIEDNINIDNNIFTYNINEIKPGEEKTIVVKAEVKQLEGQLEDSIITISQIGLGNEIYETNIKSIKTEQSAYSINLSVDTKGKEILEENDEITYIATVRNNGKNSKDIEILDELPEQLETVKIEEIKNGNILKTSESSVQNINWAISIEAGDTLILKITAKVKNIELKNTENIIVSNSVTLLMGDEELNSEEVEVTIKSDNNKIDEDEDMIDDEGKPEEPDNTIPDSDDFDDLDNPADKPEDSEGTDNPSDIPGDSEEEQNPTDKPEDSEGTDNNPSDIPEDSEGIDNPSDIPGDSEEEQNPTDKPANKFTITGLAWLDSNKNGQRDADEKLMDSVIVTLINKETGDYVKDDSGNKITATTNSNGEYKFENVKEGKYLVLFEFDTNTYTVTTYQKEGIEENINSNAIITTVSINGNKKLAGITDAITLNENKENIDIGLIENATFDLSLNKQITKVTVINAQGTQEFNYKEGDIAKVDLVAKYMNTAEVIINYKFTITNLGDTTGYVNTLVDNLPSGLEFSSELNKDWYKGSNGQLYTTSLSGIAIKPGETSEIELILTKSMTEENTGTFANNAELTKISNLENIQEDEKATENNKSSAILIISIKTGSVLLYTGITIGCISILAAGAYIIKKKILDKEI